MRFFAYVKQPSLRFVCGPSEYGQGLRAVFKEVKRPANFKQISTNDCW